jgi:hypothetical protein
MYAEFNSNIIPSLGTRRYRLYQVAAVHNLKVLFPDLTKEQYKAYSQKYHLEASHLCKIRKDISYETVDGTQRSVIMYEENKACFFQGHLILEPDYINRSRIKCGGGDECGHFPKCIVVAV